VVRALLESGVDVFRLNLAHEDLDAHERVLETVRATAQELGRIVGILADLPGLKMRTGPVRGDAIGLKTGSKLVLTSRETEGDETRISTSVGSLSRIVSEGDEIYLADGQIVLRVATTEDAEVRTEVVRGGILRSRKGMHIPSAERSLESFTEADRKPLDFAVSAGIDFVGLSFVRSTYDLVAVRNELPKRGPRPALVAKIETRGAVEALDEIVEEADAVMVARGDLGIQLRLSDVPLLQKRIIHTCNRAGKPVITATQMLESMTRDPLPTRAEAADVANAVLDGTDALMLSEETAVGAYPVTAVKTMSEIAATADVPQRDHPAPSSREMNGDRVSWAVAHAAVSASEDLAVAAIVCPTRTGATPRRVSAFRPSMPIAGLADRPHEARVLALSWGVQPMLVPPPEPEADDVRHAVAAVARAGLVSTGDLVTVVAGASGPRAGRTDFLRIVRV
jgi:pyruvate kinase